MEDCEHWVRGFEEWEAFPQSRREARFGVDSVAAVSAESDLTWGPRGYGPPDAGRRAVAQLLSLGKVMTFHARKSSPNTSSTGPPLTTNGSLGS